MKKYNVVLLGESHFCFKNGIEKGLLSENIKVLNLSLGGTPSMQNLYELVRNRKLLENADLIITGSNTHDIAQYNTLDLFIKSYQVINWLYKELFFLRKKIICFISPTPQKWLNKDCVRLVNNLHKKLAVKYGFNIIDINQIHLNNFYGLIQRDEAHDFDFVMRKLGKNIANNIRNFHYSKIIDAKNDNPKFYFYPIDNMIDIDNNMFKNKSSWLRSERVYELNNIIKFDYSVIGLNILGFHFWNESGEKKIVIHNFVNHKTCKKIFCHGFSYFFDIYDRKFLIADNTEVKSEYNRNFGLIGFLLASPEGNYYEEQINFESLAKEIVEIPKEYNFNHLIPPVEWYKEIIDEYCMIMDPKKFSSLQEQIQKLSQEKDKVQQDNIILKQTLNSLPIKKQQLEISNLEQDLINKKLQTKQLSKKLGIKMNDFMPKITMINPSSAKACIQNQLSYKLGQAMIVNSKSILGYIRMPFVLSYIKDKHKQEQKIYQEKIKKDSSLKLPPLESYPDYKEALKEKECLTYKLGEALIQANKTWYGGGYIKLLFEIRKLKREFKNR
ncbi:SGNH/GDSL hydrolase family protein [Campylobacter lari]|uniref:SGNH/GDSL hydrolase family protein n=1 Tax=Campylobacter lari TaxID=201 RepID=A0A7U8AP89_CAMLA|nr:SGNH/GDSL hydrolase family protein [Campylobacter lari]